MSVLGKTKVSKFLNAIVLIGLIIYALIKLGVSLDFEKVKKVNINNDIISHMGAVKIKSDLDIYLHDYINKIKSEEIRNAITVNYILNENKQVAEIELLIVNDSTQESSDVLLDLKKSLENYVDNVMLQEYLSENTIKQVTFNSLVTENLTNDEKQNLLQKFFENTSLVSPSQQIELKFIVDKDNRIWQIEIISKLPRSEAEKAITPLYLSLKKYADETMLAAAKQKG